MEYYGAQKAGFICLASKETWDRYFPGDSPSERSWHLLERGRHACFERLGPTNFCRQSFFRGTSRAPSTRITQRPEKPSKHRGPSDVRSSHRREDERNGAASET